MVTRSASATDTPNSGATISRHDLVLAVVPAAFLAALLVRWSLAVPLRTALSAAALFGTLVVVDALFRNPPGRSRDESGDHVA